MSLTLNLRDYPEEDWIESLYPEGKVPELLCDFNQLECLEFIYQDPSNISNLIAENAEYIKRYGALMKFEKFDLYEAPSYMLPMMKFGPSLDILKLKLIDIINDAKAGKAELASSKLLPLIKHNRRVLEQTPYIIPKVISIVESEIIIDIFAFILSKNNDIPSELWSDVIASFTPLTDNQLKMDKVILNEFVAQTRMFEVLQLENFKRYFPSVIKYIPLSLIYKKNSSMNMSYAATTANMGKIKRVGDKIIHQEEVDTLTLLHFDYTNALGSLFVKTITPKMLNLEKQIYNIEIKQRMLKHLFEQKLNKSGISGQTPYKSPYTGQGAHVIGNNYCVTVDGDIENDICISKF